jgi:hypothetical protein
MLVDTRIYFEILHGTFIESILLKRKYVPHLALNVLDDGLPTSRRFFGIVLRADIVESEGWTRQHQERMHGWLEVLVEPGNLCCLAIPAYKIYAGVQRALVPVEPYQRKSNIQLIVRSNMSSVNDYVSSLILKPGLPA